MSGGTWLDIAAGVISGGIAGILWELCTKRRARPSAALLSLHAERNAGLVFYGVFMLAGYYVYVRPWEHFGFQCRKCACSTYSTDHGGEKRCAMCDGRDIDRPDEGWLVRPEGGDERRGYRVTPENEADGALLVEMGAAAPSELAQVGRWGTHPIGCRYVPLEKPAASRPSARGSVAAIIASRHPTARWRERRLTGH